MNQKTCLLVQFLSKKRLVCLHLTHLQPFLNPLVTSLFASVPVAFDATMYSDIPSGGSFNDYLDTILSFFDHNLPLRGQK